MHTLARNTMQVLFWKIFLIRINVNHRVYDAKSERKRELIC